MKSLSFLARLVFLAIATYHYVHTGEFVFNAALFIGTTVFLYLGTKDKRFYIVDAGFMLLFSIPEVLVIIGYPLVSDVIGVDKLFHLAAGALIAYTSLLLWPRNKIVAVAFAFVVGLGWEWYEWSFGSVDSTQTITIIDTVTDLFSDVIGGALLAFFSA